MQHRHPLHCILPPYMLRNILAHTTGEVQKSALASIVGTARLRGKREAMAMPESASQALVTGKERRVYSAENGTSLPGRLVRGEKDPPTEDAAVNEAFDGAGLTYDLFLEVYSRNSVDDAGLRLDSTVHYQQDYDNAFWDGRQMVYGDGDGELFNRFTIALDVIAHELTHGVTQYTSGLNYTGQSGALNESFSDVFGSLVRQRKRGETASDADWLIGSGLFTSRVNGAALRSMKDPGTAYDDPVLGKDPQPAHMRDYVTTLEDNGGVHINSGIPNHAFFLTAVAMGGFAWEKAGRIWYVAGRDKFQTNTTLQGAADLTYSVAAELFGAGSPEQDAVHYGWEGVGLSPRLPSGTQPGTGGCLTVPVGGARRLLGRLRG